MVKSLHTRWHPDSMMTFPSQEWIDKGFWDWTLGKNLSVWQLGLCPKTDEAWYIVEPARYLSDRKIVAYCEELLTMCGDDMGKWTMEWARPHGLQFLFTNQSVATMFALLLSDG